MKSWTGVRRVIPDSPERRDPGYLPAGTGSNLSSEFNAARSGVDEDAEGRRWSERDFASLERERAELLEREQALAARAAQLEARASEVSVAEAALRAAGVVTPTQVARPLPEDEEGRQRGELESDPSERERAGLQQRGGALAAVADSGHPRGGDDAPDPEGPVAVEVLAARQEADHARLQADMLRQQLSQQRGESTLAGVLRTISGATDRQERRKVADDFKKRIEDTTSVQDIANILHGISRLPLTSRAATTRKAVSGQTFDLVMGVVQSHEYEFDTEADWVKFCADFMDAVDSDCINTISDKLMTGLPWPTAGADELSKFRAAKSAASALASTYAWLGGVVFGGSKRAALSFDAPDATAARCLLLSLPSGVRAAVEYKTNNDLQLLSDVAGFEKAATFELTRLGRARLGQSATGGVRKRRHERSPRDENCDADRQPLSSKASRPASGGDDRWRARGDDGRGRGRGSERDRDGRYDPGHDGFDREPGTYRRSDRSDRRAPEQRGRRPLRPWQEHQPGVFAAAANVQQLHGFQPVYMAPPAFAGQPQPAFYPPAAAASELQPPPPTYPPGAAATLEGTRGCYNCGDTTHVKAQCPSGPKCFDCGEFGHLRRSCPRTRTSGHLNGRR